MGATNVIAAYTLYAGRVPATSMQILAWMAVVAKDDDPNPWYGQGHAALAEFALGRGKTGPLGEKDIRAVERAIAPLLEQKAIRADRRPSVRRDGPSTVRYRLNIRDVVPRFPLGVNPAEIDQSLVDNSAQDSQRPTETVRHVPRKPSSRPTKTVLTSHENRGTEEKEETGGAREEEEGVDLPTAVTTPRAHEADTNPDPSLPTKCAHNLPSRRRPDGTPSCALCRVGAPPAERDLADVIPLRGRPA